MKLGNYERRALRPDAQAFDEVRIVTVPRYKTSGMSGDEWRISARVEFWRKGHKVHELYHRNVEMACVFLAADYYNSIDDGKAYFAGQDGVCDQEGCPEAASVTYAIKKQFSREGWEAPPYGPEESPLIRKFCSRHSTRGDCGLEDADSNYETLSGKPVGPQAGDQKPSIFGGVISSDKSRMD